MAQDRLSDAEVLFSHALHLPDFQRPEMKAYSLICLAMVLNKKRKNRCVSFDLTVPRVLPTYLIRQKVTIYMSAPYN